MPSKTRGSIEEGEVIFVNETEKDIQFESAGFQNKNFPFAPSVKLTSVLSAENNLLYAAKNLLHDSDGNFVPTYPPVGTQSSVNETTENQTMPDEYSILNYSGNISNKARIYDKTGRVTVPFDNSYTKEPGLIQLFFQFKYYADTNWQNTDGMLIYWSNQTAIDHGNPATTTAASLVLTIANGTAGGGGGPENTNLLKLTMYGDAAAEQFDVLFSNGSNFASSAVTFTDDSDNTYSATIGIQDNPTDDQVATALETLFASRSQYSAAKSLGGGGGASTVTITANTAEKTTYDIANNSSTANGISFGAPVVGAHPISPSSAAGTETLQYTAYTLHPTDMVWKPIYDTGGLSSGVNINRLKMTSSGVSLPNMIYKQMKYRWVRIDLKNSPTEGTDGSITKVKGFHWSSQSLETGDEFRISDVRVVVWNDEQAERNWIDLKSVGVGANYSDFLSPTTTNTNFIPFAHTPSNIAVSFQNVTKDGMKIIASAPFNGKIRYLCSVQG